MGQETQTTDEHGGPHILKYHLDINRPLHYLHGEPVGLTELRIVVEYDDPVCADRAAQQLAEALRLGPWNGDRKAGG